MSLKYTRHQVPRGTRPDGEKDDKLYLVKNVRILRATYQIRLLVFKCTETHQKLILKVPRGCQFHDSLKGLIALTGRTIRREDF